MGKTAGLYSQAGAMSGAIGKTQGKIYQTIGSTGKDKTDIVKRQKSADMISSMLLIGGYMGGSYVSKYLEGAETEELLEGMRDEFKDFEFERKEGSFLDIFNPFSEVEFEVADNTYGASELGQYIKSGREGLQESILEYIDTRKKRPQEEIDNPDIFFDVLPREKLDDGKLIEGGWL